MRIISGRYRGRLLPGPAGTGVRPATDKVRGAIFNILQNRLDLDGIDVLDLFAGTGSLGFEAISRGARIVTFVEDDRAAVGDIRQNATLLGCGDACEILREDAVGFLSRRSGIFGLVFADPPYAFGRIGELPGLIPPPGICAGRIPDHRTRVELGLPPGEESRDIRQHGATFSICRKKTRQRTDQRMKTASTRGPSTR